MEVLIALEKKIEGLVELLQGLKLQNTQLTQDNRELQYKIAQLEEALLKEAGRVEQELSEERTVTRRAVDDLIKSIDNLIENGENR